jgi:hypothetical protein
MKKKTIDELSADCGEHELKQIAKGYAPSPYPLADKQVIIEWFALEGRRQLAEERERLTQRLDELKSLSGFEYAVNNELINVCADSMPPAVRYFLRLVSPHHANIRQSSGNPDCLNVYANSAEYKVRKCWLLPESPWKEGDPWTKP